MLKIRLKQTGKRDQRGYRVVVVDERKKRDGAVIETIGHIAPGSKPFKATIQKDRFNHWQGKGAQISDGVRKIITA